MDPGPASRRTGFVGVVPGRVGIVAEGLDEGLLQRWDRWFELASARGLPERLDAARPVWRLAAASGIFAAGPVFGAWRLGHDRLGRLYPFAILAQGAPPEAADAWFDAAAAAVAASGGVSLAALSGLVSKLPRPGPPADPPLLRDAAAVVWRDDWEVHEHRCPTAADLIAFPLELAAEVTLDEAA